MKSHRDKSHRHGRRNNSVQIAENAFLQDLQDSLMVAPHDIDPYGINAFEEVYNQKKIINTRIESERRKKLNTQQALLKAKQRIAQVQQLNDKVQKQGSLLKNQIEKINDVHTLSKILMMQKILKLQRQTQDLQRKRHKNYQIRTQKHRASLSHRVGTLQKIQRSRFQSLQQTKQLQQQKQSKNYHSWKCQKQRMQHLRSQKQRRRQKSLRIEEYKRMIAQKNYNQKLIGMQSALEAKQDQLQHLCMIQSDEKKQFRATKDIATEYMKSFFATQTI